MTLTYTMVCYSYSSYRSDSKLPLTSETLFSLTANIDNTNKLEYGIDFVNIIIIKNLHTCKTNTSTQLSLYDSQGK